MIASNHVSITNKFLNYNELNWEQDIQFCTFWFNLWYTEKGGFAGVTTN